MKKHPSAFKLTGELIQKNKEVKDEAVVLYDGMSLYIELLYE